MLFDMCFGHPACLEGLGVADIKFDIGVKHYGQKWFQLLEVTDLLILYNPCLPVEHPCVVVHVCIVLGFCLVVHAC